MTSTLRSSSMRVYEFSQKYLKYMHKKKYIDLPAVHIRVFSPDGGSYRTFALVDSGATVSFLPTEIGDILNLTVIDESEALGAGGNFETNISEITLEILKGMKRQHMMTIKVQIPKESGKVPYAILGRDCMFKDYDITFREKLKRTIFRHQKGR